MARYIFIQVDNESGRSTEVKVDEDAMTWTDLSEEFFAFLQGCGYVLTREDFAKYWAQYLQNDSANDTDDDSASDTDDETDQENNYFEYKI